MTGSFVLRYRGVAVATAVTAASLTAVAAVVADIAVASSLSVRHSFSLSPALRLKKGSLVFTQERKSLARLLLISRAHFSLSCPKRSAATSFFFTGATWSQKRLRAR